MITILIVDDQKTSQQFLKKSLETEGDFQIIGLANNGQEAVEKAGKFKPDIIVMDINMPIMDGLSATKIITERYKSTKILMFSLFDDDESLSNAIEAGAKGYLLKNTPAEEIILAVRSAYQGYFQLGPGLLEKYLYRFSVNSISHTAIDKKLAKASALVEKEHNINLVFGKIFREVSKLEKNMLLNRSLIYVMFLFNSFLLLFVVFN